MKRRTRIYYTPEQKAVIWDRYKQGDSLHDIARMFDRYHSSIMPTNFALWAKGYAMSPAEPLMIAGISPNECSLVR